MITKSAHDEPGIRATPLRNWARRSPAGIRSVVVFLWLLARLEWPRPLAVAKHRWESRSPTTYEGKIRYKMARDRRPLITLFADKLAARDYVAERIGDGVLLPHYDRASTAAGISWHRLPEEFVAKVNHGCGGVIVVSRAADRAEVLPSPADRPGWSRHHIHPDNADPAAIAALCDYWLGLTYGWSINNYLEWAYLDIAPAVFVEEYAGGDDGLARSVKVHCFNGVPRTFTITHFDESRAEESAGRFLATELDSAAVIAGVDSVALARLLEQSRALCADTDFVRIDWLITPHGLRFGELTNYPAGGHPAPMGLGSDSPFDIGDLYFAAWTLPRRYTSPLPTARLPR